MVQPKDLPTFATTTNFAAGARPWSSTPRRVLPFGSEAADGYAPEDPVKAQWYNAHVGLILEHLQFLADQAALNFPEYGTSETDGVVGNSSSFPVMVSGPDANGMPWLLGLTSSGVYRSRDGQHWHSGVTQPAGVSPVSGVASALLIGTLDGTNGNVYVTTDGGNSWSGANSLGSATWSHLAIDTISGSVFAFGTGKVRVSGGAMNSWSAVAIPGSWTNGCARVVAPSYGDTKQGLIVCGDTGNNVLTWDGATWTDRTPGDAGAYAAGCWSESAQAWYLLTANGHLWRSGDLVSWTQTASFGGTCFDIMPLGRNLIITGQNIGVGGPVGQVLVTSDEGATATTFSPFQPLDSGYGPGTEVGKNTWTRIGRHDGRLFLARIRATASALTRPFELALGVRTGLQRGTTRH